MSNLDGDSDPDDVELPPPKFQARTFRKRPEGATSTFKFGEPGALDFFFFSQPLGLWARVATPLRSWSHVCDFM